MKKIMAVVKIVRSFHLGFCYIQCHMTSLSQIEQFK